MHYRAQILKPSCLLQLQSIIKPSFYIKKTLKRINSLYFRMMNQQITVRVKKQDKKEASFVFSPSTTLMELKNSIFNLWGVSPEHQHLQFDQNYLLDDQSTLGDFITHDQDDAEISLVAASQRFEFSDLSQKEEQSVGTTTNTKDPTIIKPGLILRAKCKNEACDANKKKALVCMNRGFGSFDLGKLLWSGKCPLCEQKTTRVENIGYYKTNIVLQGVKANGQQYNLSESASNNKYHTFKQSCDTIEWSFLDISTLPL